MNPSIIIRIMFVTFLCLALLLLINTNAFTRGYEGCMYGQITLKNGNSYRGGIRWGNEEAFWNDMFNSNKAETIFDLYLSQDDLNSLENDRLETGRGLSSSGRNWKNRQRSTIHQFKCRFGDIEQMKLSPGNVFV